MLKNLYIFHPTVDFSTVDPTSVLLDQVDIELPNSQYHTSLGDLSVHQISYVSERFDTITFIDCGFDKQSNIYKETTILLTYLQHFCKVLNFVSNDPINFTNNLDIYQHPSVPTLWAFGCSHTAGVGLDSVDQTYSSILSKELGMPLKLIAEPGSSTEWSLRHLLNANIQKGDIVIWQLTAPNRITKGLDSNGKTTELRLVNGSLTDVEFFSDPQLLYHHISLLNIGLKFLRNLKVKFAVISVTPNSNFYYNYLSEYTKHPEYCYLTGYVVDYGGDNLHAGPQSHQNLANGILKFLSRQA